MKIIKIYYQWCLIKHPKKNNYQRSEKYSNSISNIFVLSSSILLMTLNIFVHYKIISRKREKKLTKKINILNEIRQLRQEIKLIQEPQSKKIDDVLGKVDDIDVRLKKLEKNFAIFIKGLKKVLLKVEIWLW